MVAIYFRYIPRNQSVGEKNSEEWTLSGLIKIQRDPDRGEDWVLYKITTHSSVN